MNTGEILSEVQKGLRLFKAFEHAEKVVSALQNAEQVEKETLARIEAAKAQLIELDVARQTAEASIAEAKAAAKAILSKAKGKAEQIEADSAEAVKAAKASADAYVAEAGAARDAIQAQVVELTGVREGLQAELDALNSKIDAAKKRIEKMLGG